MDHATIYSESPSTIECFECALNGRRLTSTGICKNWIFNPIVLQLFFVDTVAESGTRNKINDQNYPIRRIHTHTQSVNKSWIDMQSGYVCFFVIVVCLILILQYLVNSVHVTNSIAV